MLEHMEHDFRYISKNDPKVKQAYQNLLDILHQVQDVDHSVSHILHSCDLAIVYDYDEEGKSLQQYIHFNKDTQTYMWCKQPKGYYMLHDKIDWLKKNRHWQELRDYYIYKKNINTNPDVHSRTLFAIAVHEMCQKKGYRK